MISQVIHRKIDLLSGTYRFSFFFSVGALTYSMIDKVRSSTDNLHASHGRRKQNNKKQNKINKNNAGL